MEIKITAKQMLKVLYLLSWIIFIGVCVEAGGFIFNAVLTLTVDGNNARHLWKQVDLSALHSYDTGHFLVMYLLVIIVAVMRCCLFYLIVKILHDKKLDLSQPFNRELGSFMTNASFLALGMGFFSLWGMKYRDWLMSHNVQMPSIEALRIGGADVWLFMGVVLLVIAQIFKRGIEMQTENELTV